MVDRLRLLPVPSTLLALAFLCAWKYCRQQECGPGRCGPMCIRHMMRANSLLGRGAAEAHSSKLPARAQQTSQAYQLKWLLLVSR